MSLRSILKGIGCVRSSFNFIRVIWVIPIQVRQVYRFSSFSAVSLAVYLAKAANRHLGLANANSYANYYPLGCGRTGYLPLRQVKISLTRNPRTKPYKVPQKYGGVTGTVRDSVSYPWFQFAQLIVPYPDSTLCSRRCAANYDALALLDKKWVRRRTHPKKSWKSLQDFDRFGTVASSSFIRKTACARLRLRRRAFQWEIDSPTFWEWIPSVPTRIHFCRLLSTCKLLGWSAG